MYIEMAVYVVPKFVIVFLKLFGSTVHICTVYIYTTSENIFAGSLVIGTTRWCQVSTVSKYSHASVCMAKLVPFSCSECPLVSGLGTAFFSIRYVPFFSFL